MNKFKNQIKLYYLTGRGSDRTKKIMNIIENVHSKMEKRLDDKYPDSTFYMIDDKLFFDLDSKNERTWVKYSNFWWKFRSEFNLTYNETRWLTKYTLEQHLKRKVFPTISTKQHLKQYLSKK